MKTFYSILYIKLHSALNEKVSIGCIMSNGQKHFYHFSNEKLSIIKNLMDSEKFHLTKKYLRSLEKDLVFDSQIGNQLFANNTFKNNWVSENQLAYLSNYSHNLIQFSEPKTIDIEFSYDNFIQLFEKYIRKIEPTEESEPKSNIHTRIKEVLYPKIETKVNLEILLNFENFENLFAPITIDFLGLNGTPLAGQTIDFEKKYNSLENEITRFVSLTKAIELEGNPKGKYFILGKEPQKEDVKKHLLWEHIKDSDFLEFVDIEEYGIVEDYILTNDVRPYF